MSDNWIQLISKKESCNEATNNQWKVIFRERSRDTSESSDTYGGWTGWRNIIMRSHSSLLHLLTSPGEFHVLSLHSQPHLLSSIAFSFSSSPPLPSPSPPLPTCALSSSWSLTNPSCCFTPDCVETSKNICVWSRLSQKETLKRTKEIAGQLK